MPGRRILSLWFPRLAAERVERQRQDVLPVPLAVVEEVNGAQILASLTAAAEAAGLRLGQPLRDATAICPDLLTLPADPLAEARFLGVLRRWAGRFSPWVAEEPPASLLILFEMRRYGALSRKIAQMAREQGHVVVMVSDPHCDWAAEVSDIALTVATESRLFWDSQTAFLGLTNLLLDAVAQRLQDSIGARASVLDRMVSRFGLVTGG